MYFIRFVDWYLREHGAPFGGIIPDEGENEEDENVAVEGKEAENMDHPLRKRRKREPGRFGDILQATYVLVMVSAFDGPCQSIRVNNYKKTSIFVRTKHIM